MEMVSKTASGHFINPNFEDDNPTSEDSMEQKLITNDAEKKTGHAKPARILLALVITACLISLLSLLLTILVFGKIGDSCGCSANEASSPISTKSLTSVSFMMRDLKENVTSFQKVLMENIHSAFTGLTSHFLKKNNELAELNNTLIKFENIDSVFSELTSHVAKTNKDLEELNNTVLRKMENIDSAFIGLTSHLTKTNKDLAELNNTLTKVGNIDSAVNQLTSRVTKDLEELNNTVLRKMENMDSAFVGLTSHLIKTNEDLAELNSTLRKVESIDSAFTELTSHVTKTNKDVEELNNTMLRKMENIDSSFTVLMSHLTKTNKDLVGLNNSLTKIENIDSSVSQLTSHVTKTNKDLKEINNTMLRKMENIDSAFIGLTSHLIKTNEDLAELNSTLRKLTGCQGPCKNGKINYTAGEEDTFECVCDPGFYGKYCEKAAKSCQELYDAYNFTTSQLVTLRPGSASISVFCHVGDFGCGDGVWTPVMKTDGNKSTFHYNSDYWSNKAEYNLPGGETGFDSQETKLPTYWNTTFNKICLGMKIDNQTRFITIDTGETSSLYSLISGGNYHSTSLGRDGWKKLIGSEASLQYNCNKEGFNTACSNSLMSRARIGFVANEQHDCSSCDSRIGFGTGGYPDDSNTCGNEAAHWGPDNGIKTIKAMGYILVR